MLHDPIEERAFQTHRRIAERLRRDPGLIAEALVRLKQRIAREGAPSDPVLCEWVDALLMLDPPQLADFIESGTPRARRLRISSPLSWLARWSARCSTICSAMSSRSRANATS
jgi:hypothetical protein